MVSNAAESSKNYYDKDWEFNVEFATHNFWWPWQKQLDYNGSGASFIERGSKKWEDSLETARADNSLKKFCSKGKKDGSELLEGSVSVCKGRDGFRKGWIWFN